MCINIFYYFLYFRTENFFLHVDFGLCSAKSEIERVSSFHSFLSLYVFKNFTFSLKSLSPLVYQFSNETKLFSHFLFSHTSSPHVDHFSHTEKIQVQS